MRLSGGNRRELGASGEEIARRRLESLGWRILASNYRCPAGEIDLVAEEPSPAGPVLVFVEVKTRRSPYHGAPVEAVDARKQARLNACARCYLGERAAGGAEPACRFDVMEVFAQPGGVARVVLRRAAFDFTG